MLLLAMVLRSSFNQISLFFFVNAMALYFSHIHIRGYKKPKKLSRKGTVGIRQRHQVIPIYST